MKFTVWTERGSPIDDLKDLHKIIRADRKIPIFADEESTKRLITESQDPIMSKKLTMIYKENMPMDEVKAAWKQGYSQGRYDKRFIKRFHPDYCQGCGWVRNSKPRIAWKIGYQTALELAGIESKVPDLVTRRFFRLASEEVRVNTSIRLFLMFIPLFYNIREMDIKFKFD